MSQQTKVRNRDVVNVSALGRQLEVGVWKGFFFVPPKQKKMHIYLVYISSMLFASLFNNFALVLSTLGLVCLYRDSEKETRHVNRWLFILQTNGQ